MKIAGIIAEYNPFHNGHKYHIEQTKLITNADAIVVVMSGNFVQRGECAICDKWTRTRAALLGGADLVIELPVYYSLATAQLFSFGAVSLLNSLGVVDYLSFGTEENELEQLSNLADSIVCNKDKIENEIEKYIDNTSGYPAALACALSSLFGIDENILKSPNNILALEYLQTLKILKSKIEPICVKRNEVEHHAIKPKGSFASASTLRAYLKNNKSIKKFVPKEAYNTFKSAQKNGLFPIFTSHFDKSLLSYLRRVNPCDLKGILDMPTGYENRIITMAKKAGTIDELTELCSARQYTHSRIRRLLFSSFLGINAMGYDKLPSYIRILGANDIGKTVLATMKEKASLPIITKAADYSKKDTDPLFKLDIMATDLYSSSYDVSSLRSAGKDFTTSPIML